MILGLGIDLIDITRVKRSIERFGDRFLNRCFTDIERARAARRPLIADASYAKRFAAKEACAKALGTGMRAGVFWRDMGVVNLPGGRPTLVLTARRIGAPAVDHAAGDGGADRLDDNRRAAAGTGDGDYFRGSAGSGGTGDLNG